MNAVRFEFDYELDESSDQLFLFFRVLIDERDLLEEHPGDVVSFPELWRSFYKSGEYHIPTCSCGIPSCGGYYRPTRVFRDPETVSWKVPAPIDAEYVFDRKQFQRSVDHLRRALQALHCKDPIDRLGHCPDHNLDSVTKFMRGIEPT